MNKLYPLFLIPLLATAANAARAVMEGIAATSNTIYVDTVNVRVGIKTASPGFTLDVNGSANIGSFSGATTFGSSVTINAAAKILGAADIQRFTQPATFESSVTINAPLSARNINTATTFASSTTHNAGMIVRQAANIQNLSQPATFASSVTINGTAFQVDGATFAISGGNVGINVSAPSNRLAIRADSGNVIVQNVLSSDNQSIFTVEQAASAGAGLIAVYDASGASGATIRGAGDSYIENEVGIGIASPSSKLHVKSPTGNVFVQNVISSDDQSLFTIEQAATAGAGLITVYDASGSPGATIRGAGDSFTLNKFGVGAFTGFTSTLTVTGLIESQGQGVKFGDGSIQEFAFVYKSTFSKSFLTNTFNNTAYSACHSTLTMTTTGRPIRISINFSMLSSVAGGRMSAMVLQDGAYISPYSAATAMWMAYYPGAVTAILVGGAPLIMPAPSAASHSWCLAFKIDSGTVSFDQNINGYFAVEEY